MLVVRKQPLYGHDSDQWLGFERLTRVSLLRLRSTCPHNCVQVPIQKSLVDYALLNASEREWLKAHNRQCQKTLLPLLKHDKRAAKWLRSQ